MKLPTPTREAALARLSDFTANMGPNYTHKRNFDYGQDANVIEEAWRDNVSRLSPYIRHGILTQREVVEAALDAHGPKGADKFITEILWRGYFKGYLEQRPEIWADYVAAREAAYGQLKTSGVVRKVHEQALEGRTGIDCFDHWMHELIETGYLHNHARMWFASIWIFTLKLPWELGADLFLRHLLDGDAASNTLSWRWVAGLHTKGKHYLATKENIAQFTDGRFNAVGLAADAKPLDDDKSYKLRPLKIPSVPPAAADFALIVHEEDCYPESLELPGRPSVLIGVAGPESKSAKSVSDKVISFSRGAVDDAMTRGAAHFECDAVMWEQGQRLADIMKQNGVERLLSPWLPVGALNDAVGGQIRGNGARWVMREYDAAVWPLAKAGFFPVKKKAPDALRSIGIAI